MIPSDPTRAVVDPRRMVREQGREALAELVARESGYIFQLRPLKDLCLRYNVLTLEELNRLLDAYQMTEMKRDGVAHY